MAQGMVKWFDVDKGYGFIAVDGSPDVFVDSSAITDPSHRLEAGQRVEFEIMQGTKGPQAHNVRVINGATAPTTAQGWVKWYDAEKGYGMIAVDGGSPDVFVDSSAITDPSHRLEAEQRVAFNIGQGMKGPQATDVRVINGATAPTTTTEPIAASRPRPTTVPLLRAFSPGSGDHFYTTDVAERDNAVAKGGYVNEGVACQVFPAGTGPTPLLRAFTPATGDHFYTTSVAERDNAVAKLGYVDEGVACHVYPSPGTGTTPLLRAFSPTSGDHFYTTSVAERDNAVAKGGYVDEGVACYVFSS